MTLVSRFAGDPIYQEKVREADLAAADDTCSDCGGKVTGYICTSCWQRNHPDVRFNWNVPADLVPHPEAIPPW